MKPVNWVHFSWDLSKSLPTRPPLPPSFSLRRATPADHEAVRAVVLSSLTLDSEWNPFFREVRTLLEAALAEVFHEKEENPFCLVLSHGVRVIGASALSAAPEAHNHLLTGLCLSMEYHNRGLATALLAHSLIALRDCGLTEARGSTKEGSTAAQFVYPKFGSVRIAPLKRTGPASEAGRSAHSK